MLSRPNEGTTALSTKACVSINPRDLEAAASELHALRRLQSHRALVAASAAGLAVTVAAVDLRFSFALAVGALAEGVLALVVRLSRHEILLRLASDGDAYVLPEVRRFGASLTSPRRRSAIARMIVGVLREASGSPSLYLVDRVAARAPALVAIAAALADDQTEVEPTAMAFLQRLLTDGEASPLLNPSLPSGEVTPIVVFVLAGIHPPVARAK